MTESARREPIDATASKATIVLGCPYAGPGAVIVLAVAALLATLVPAIRAASIAPVVALQQD